MPSQSSSTGAARTILDDAHDATDGANGAARPQRYGHPLDHFGLTARLVSERFREKLLEPFTAEDWAVVMVLDKVARHAFVGDRDSLADIAGYARAREMVDAERARRGMRPASEA